MVRKSSNTTTHFQLQIVRHSFSIGKFATIFASTDSVRVRVCASKVQIQRDNFNVQTPYKIRYLLRARVCCFEIYLPFFNDHSKFLFCFPRFSHPQIAIVVLMVIACTDAKPAIVAPAAAIAYSAPLVAAAAPLPFVTATSSQVVRNHC